MTVYLFCPARSFQSSCEVTNIPASSASPARVPDTVSSRDLESYKLLRHLQSRIRQLQVDTQGHTLGAVRLNRDRGNPDLAGSYLETVRSITVA